MIRDDHMVGLGLHLYKPPQLDFHINDHCFIQDSTGAWHAFGIEAANPFSSAKDASFYFFHIMAACLTQEGWTRLPNVLDTSIPGETVLWAPHVVHGPDGMYYMFYCSGGADPTAFAISLAVSPDLMTWQRYGIDRDGHQRDDGVLFRDGFQARDPMVLGIDNQWVMYYAATSSPTHGNYVIKFCTSEQLPGPWSAPVVAFEDSHVGSYFGPTESPFVVPRDGRYYLFLGPRPYEPAPVEPLGGWQNWRHSGYDGTDVFVSTTWRRWTALDRIGHLQAHAAEVVRDHDGRWYVSRAGIRRGGLFLMPLVWLDVKDNRPYGPPPCVALGEARLPDAGNPDHMDLFWIDPNGAVYSTWWDHASNDGRWDLARPFPLTGPGATRPGAVATLARTPDHLDVFWVDAAESIYSMWWDRASTAPNGGWANKDTPFPISGPGMAQPGTVTAVARTPEHMDVFWVHPDGSVYVARWAQAANNGKWNPGRPTGTTDPGVLPITTADTALPGAVTALARNPDHLDVFWAHPDGSIHSTWWDRTSPDADGGWNATNRPFRITNPGMAQPGTVTAVARTPEHMDVFWVHPDGSVHTTWWDQSSTAPIGGWDTANRPFAVTGRLATQW